MKLPRIDHVAPAKSFTVTSGALLVTDPCYRMDAGCAGTLDKVKNGPWVADVGYHKDAFDAQPSGDIGLIAYIRICYADHAIKRLSALDLSDYNIVGGLHVGVDSGKAGFFDLAQYVEAVSDKPSKGGRKRGGGKFDTFYRRVCDLVHDTREGFGVVEFGAVSSSGYGDGGYICLVKRNTAGEVIEAVIVFITMDLDEDDDPLDDEMGCSRRNQ